MESNAWLFGPTTIYVEYNVSTHFKRHRGIIGKELSNSCGLCGWVGHAHFEAQIVDDFGISVGATKESTKFERDIIMNILPSLVANIVHGGILVVDVESFEMLYRTLGLLRIWAKVARVGCPAFKWFRSCSIIDIFNDILDSHPPFRSYPSPSPTTFGNFFFDHENTSSVVNLRGMYVL